MKIIGIEIFLSKIKLKEPFVISLGKMEYAENIVVRIRTEVGISGFGECSPFMTINGESMETGFLVGQYLARALKGKDALDIAACSKIMDSVIYGNSSIKSAFDIALYDIASQYANLPLYRFLAGENNKVLITDFTVSLGHPEKMASDAKSIVDRGFQIIKVKLGESKDKDLERIQHIRNAVGFEIPIRIDANQGWETIEAIDTLKALAPYNIQHCEEPISRWKYMELLEVRNQSPIPIMADESCCDHYDAKRLIDLSLCDMINIKLGKSSGIFKALKIIELAEKANMKIQIGGFLESRLGVTAAAHLALSSENITYFDFDTPLMISEDFVVGGISYSDKGVVSVPSVSGLGASMDEGYLKSLPKVFI